jgi:hypothetical protein
MSTFKPALTAPRFTVGDWDALTAEQHRIFITFAKANYASEIGAGDPALFSKQLWNDSALAANTGAGGGARLLDQSRLTTFIGVTSLWAKTGVSDQVTLVTDINGDQPDRNFRLFGELKPGGGEVVKKAFTFNIAGSGHSEYSVSRREQGLLGQPNGQFSMTPDLMRFDGDVDYRRLLSPGHNTKENSDIRAFDGNTAHLERHVKRYGPVPIIMQTFRDVAVPPGMKEEEYRLALAAGDLFVSRFESRLTLEGIFEEMFAPDAIEVIKESGFFEAAGLDKKLVAGSSRAALEAFYKALMDFYYLNALREMNTKNISTGRTISAPPGFDAELDAALRASTYLRALADPLATDGGEPRIKTGEQLEEFAGELRAVSAIIRRQLRAIGLYSELHLENLTRVEEQQRSPSPVERRAAPRVGRGPVLVVERGIYIIFFEESSGALKISNLGVGN